MRVQSRFHIVEKMLLTGQQRQFVKLLENKKRLIADSDSGESQVREDQAFSELEMPQVSGFL